jgi:flavorubredoxin
VEEELRYIRVWFQLGCRMMHLTYNRRNMLGDGCAEPDDAGLSDFGRRVIEEMNRIGVIVDVAHSGLKSSLEAAKRYFAEIMMPFRAPITKNIEKLKAYDIRMIAPGHGQVYDSPSLIMEAYHDWVMAPPHNVVVLPYVSMHGSTKKMVDYLTSSLVEEGVRVELFNLAVTDIGKLAMALVDAATIVLGVPTVLAGPHPLTAYAALLANALRPKARYLSIIGSYGWGGKAVETLAGMIPNLKVELLNPVLAKGLPLENEYKALDMLARTIAEKHKEEGLR